MKTIVNYGGGVNSTAILALMCKGELDYDNPLILFSDTGAEKPQTYEYIEYIKPKLKEYGFEITTVKSKEGSLYDYCKDKIILPMRRLRWCTDRWKAKPLEQFEGKKVIGIDYGEKHRASRWKDGKADFPLIDLKLDREGCKEIIKGMGWKVPVKSGCWFCPYAKIQEFKELKQDNPKIFYELCDMEKETLNRLDNAKMKGWYKTIPLNQAVNKKFPEVDEDQRGMCLYCHE